MVPSELERWEWAHGSSWEPLAHCAEASAPSGCPMCRVPISIPRARHYREMSPRVPSPLQRLGSPCYCCRPASELACHCQETTLEHAPGPCGVVQTWPARPHPIFPSSRSWAASLTHSQVLLDRRHTENHWLPTGDHPRKEGTLQS